MPFMLKIQWDIKEGREAEFKTNQEKLCKVMHDDHPGVICYHVDYPKKNVSEWVEIYANDDTFRAHLANEKARSPSVRLSPPAKRLLAAASAHPTRNPARFLKVSEPLTIRRRRTRSPSVRGPTGTRRSELRPWPSRST